MFQIDASSLQKDLPLKRDTPQDKALLISRSSPGDLLDPFTAKVLIGALGGFVFGRYLMGTSNAGSAVAAALGAGGTYIMFENEPFAHRLMVPLGINLNPNGVSQSFAPERDASIASPAFTGGGDASQGIGFRRPLKGENSRFVSHFGFPGSLTRGLAP